MSDDTPVVDPPVENPTPVDPENVDPDPFPFPASVAIDLGKLKTVSDERYDTMSKNPDHRGDVDLTFSAFCRGVIAGKDQALSDAITAQAQVVAADYVRRGVGAIATRRSLAAKVIAGDFALEVQPDPVPQPEPDTAKKKK